MLMSIIWLGMVAAAILYGAATGKVSELSSAVFEGAGAAVELCLGILGALCLWCAVMEVMRQSGIGEGLSRLLSPLLKRLFPKAFSDRECAEAISANFTANLLGLGNAATPAGLRAVERMRLIPNCENELCRLVVMNSSSLQLIPATLGAIRLSLGSENPFDILPCIWLSSLAALAAGLISARLMERKCH